MQTISYWNRFKGFKEKCCAYILFREALGWSQKNPTEQIDLPKYFLFVFEPKSIGKYK